MAAVHQLRTAGQVTRAHSFMDGPKATSASATPPPISAHTAAVQTAVSAL
jgi:hypothetical protein